MKDQLAYSQLAEEYDQWFEKHHNLYQSELLAVGKAIPENSVGIEIGIGTGRFSIPFNIHMGVDPSESMAKIAEGRGIKVARGVAEHLPVENETFDFALLVTTVCFLSDIPQSFAEVKRILKPGGSIIIGLIDKNSELGKKYELHKTGNVFYKTAHFHSTGDITNLLQHAGFKKFEYWQTLITSDESIIEQPQQGYGQGSFVVIKAMKVEGL